MKKLFITFSVIIMMAFSCGEATSLTPFAGDIVRVKSGQSFGMCIGKCYNELIVENKSVILKQIERKERGGESETTEYRDASRWPQIKADLRNFPARQFQALEDRYGCPDCADGGAEWLEILFSDGQVKRVTFEYGASLEGFEDVISVLRTHRLSIMEKYR